MTSLLRGADVRAAGLDGFLLRPEHTLRDALRRFRRTGGDIAVVVDGEGKVVGTVTDDAIRRAALTGMTPDGRVSEIVSTRHLVAAGATDEEILGQMRMHRARSVAVVDRDGRLSDVRALGGFLDPRSDPVAVLMAGGRGERLRPLTDKVPKPLLRVGASSIVEQLIASLAAAGVEDVYVAVGYKADEFERRLGTGDHLGVRLRFLREEEPLGTAGALARLPAVAGPIVVSNADIVTDLDFARLLDFHWRHGGALTVAAVSHLSPIPYAVLETADYHLVSIQEKPHRRDLCSAGIYVLEPDVLRFIVPEVPLAMPDLIAQVLDEGLVVNVFPLLEKWFDIGGSAEFERVLVDFAVGEDEEGG